MASKIIFVCIIILMVLTTIISAQNSTQFIYNGFRDDNLYLDGPATIQSGMLQLTYYSKKLTAHAFYPTSIKFSSSSSLSFSTTFTFAVYPEIEAISGHGIFFSFFSRMTFHLGVPGKFFGLFNSSADFSPADHIFGVELDAIQDYEFNDIDSNHVGINVNSLISNASASAAYFSDVEKKSKSLRLISGEPLQIWIEYNDNTMLIQVTLAPLGDIKPSRPALSAHVNLSDILLDTM